MNLDRPQLDKAKINTAFDVTGTDPAEMSKHSIAETWVLRGMMPAEFNSLHAGAQFKMSKLEEAFTKVCPDYTAKLVEGTPNIALEFCSLVLFQVGPATRSIKKGQNDNKWKFLMAANDDIYVVYVSTHKNNPPPEVQPVVKNNKLLLTIKQASLLSLKMLSDLMLMNNSNYIILTPLAGAIFSKDDIDRIALKLGKSRQEVACTMNESAQSGGFYLRNSSTAVAAVCALVATRNGENKKLMESIVVKTIKQYTKAHREFDENDFAAYGAYATGGVPRGLTPAILLAKLDKEQEFTRTQFMEEFEKLKLGDKEDTSKASSGN